MRKFNLNDDIDFVNVKDAAEAFYRSIGAVRLPYLHQLLSFNAKGWKHVTFKNEQRARIRTDQHARSKLLHLAPEVLRKSHTLQGMWTTRKFKVRNTSSRWERILREVIYYEFIAVLGNVQMKVIVKKVVEGQKHFLSVIPFWGINITSKWKLFDSGDPSQD